MMQKQPDGTIFISKGTPFPYLCPKCDDLVPCTAKNFNQPQQKCSMCGYEGPIEEFDVEWEFTPSSVQ